LFTKEYCPQPGLLSQTFISSTSAIHGSKTIIHELLNGGYYGPQGKNLKIHTYFVDKLKQLAERYPQLIQGPYGSGTMIAFTPLDGTAQQVHCFVQALFEGGLMTYVAGSNPTRTRMLVPMLVITERDMDEAAKIIEQTLIAESKKGG
jgi:acetylornithine/succinyldiaminopimelate/putrescine aminotransferase